jgi:hypothetical protein
VFTALITLPKKRPAKIDLCQVLSWLQMRANTCSARPLLAARNATLNPGRKK